MIRKEVYNQDSYFKTEEVHSGESSLNLSQEILAYICSDIHPSEEKSISFNLIKQDYVDAIAYIAGKLPLYTSSSTSATKVTPTLNFFSKLLSEINSLFGNNTTAIYSVNLLYKADGRIYLNNLDCKGFNIRHFLLSGNSVLEFDNSEGTLSIRLKSGEFNCLIREKKANMFGLAVCKYFWNYDRLASLQPYFTISSHSTNYVQLIYNGKTLFRFLNPDTTDVNRGKKWDDVEYDVDGTKYLFCREWTEAENNSSVPSIAVLKYIIESVFKNEYSIVKEDEYFILRHNSQTGDVSVNALDSNIHISNLPIQQIFYGAPGTGKSYEISIQTKGKAVVRTTFHPDSDYSTFVGSYKPVMGQVRKSVVIGVDEKEVKPLQGSSEYEGKIQYSFVKQAFLKAYLGAWRKYAESKMSTNPTTPDPQFLVIEEINRGNCAQIFGDIFQLLDREDSGFSSYPIEADTDLQQEIARAFSEEEEYMIPADLNIDNAVEDYTSNYGATLSDDIINGRVMLLPPNMYIWATMNTSDQSLFPIDSAFKRRWDWTYMPIDTTKESWVIDIDGTMYSWTSFLQKINKAIEDTTSSEDKQLGFYFCKAQNDVITANTFVSKVMFYLYNDVFKDYGLENEFFKDKDNSDKTITFRNLYKGIKDIDFDMLNKLLGNLEVEIVDGKEDEEKAAMDVSTYTQTQQKRKEFWADFLDYANNNSSEYTKYFGGRKTPSRDKWYHFFIGKGDCKLCVEQTRTHNELYIGLDFQKTTENFYKLQNRKDDIEKELDITFDWQEKPSKMSSYIVEVTPNVDFDNKEKQNELFDFIIDRLLRMRTVFLKYLDM